MSYPYANYYPDDKYKLTYENLQLFLEEVINHSRHYHKKQVPVILKEDFNRIYRTGVNQEVDNSYLYMVYQIAYDQKREWKVRLHYKLKEIFQRKKIQPLTIQIIMPHVTIEKLHEEDVKLRLGYFGANELFFICLVMINYHRLSFFYCLTKIVLIPNLMVIIVF